MDYRANITIATYNRLELTKQSLPNIFDTASENIPFMLSVIDNGSSDGTPEYLQQLFNEKRLHNLILLPKNIGISKAHNIFWKMYEDLDYYAKIDNDITFNRKNWMDDILYILERRPNIGCLGYSVETPGYYPIVNDGDISYRRKGGNIGGACFFVPKRTKDVLGFWNEGFDLYGEEDADYGYRIIKSNLLSCYMVDDTKTMNHLSEQKNDYTEFKKKQRNNNLSGIWRDTIIGYNTNKKPLKIETNAINDIKFELQTHVGK